MDGTGPGALPSADVITVSTDERSLSMSGRMKVLWRSGHSVTPTASEQCPAPPPTTSRLATEIERTNPRRAQRQRPWPGASFDDLSLQPGLMAEEEVELISRAEVLLRADPHRPYAMLAIDRQLCRPGADVPLRRRSLPRPRVFSSVKYTGPSPGAIRRRARYQQSTRNAGPRRSASATGRKDPQGPPCWCPHGSPRRATRSAHCG
jgi:hypothetical protein